eukprot:ANDGO_02670.mRNA.1 Lateral signaling target protein 2 homolog
MAEMVLANAPVTKECPQWESDKDVKSCKGCKASFSLVNRKHHCRNCGKIFCTSCCFAHVQLPNWVTAERICENCHLSFARGGRAVPNQLAGGNEGLYVENPSGTAEYHDILVDSQKDGVTARGSSNLTLMGCHVKAANIGVQKSGNGYLTLTDCEIQAKEGVTVGGSVKLSISGGIIIADEVCIRARGSGTLTLQNCHIICKNGTAIECAGGVKAELINCTVSGKRAISGSGSCEFTIRGGCVSSQNALHPMLLKTGMPFPGRDANTIVFKGPCKLEASEGAKIVGNNSFPSTARINMAAS